MSCKLAVALVLTLAPCFAGATEARSRLPDGYVPAPTGKGWSEGPNMWREYDHAGRRVVKCLAGTQDEIFIADRYAETLAQAGRALPVTLVDGVDHMGMTLDRRGIAAVVDAAR